MKKLLALFGIVSIASAAFSAPTANEDFVVAEDARTYTNAVAAAKEYTDAAVADIDVDMSAVTNIAQEAATAAQERAVADAADYTDRATNAALSAAFSAAVEYTDNQIGPVQESVTSLDDRVEAAEGSLSSAWTELWDNYQWRLSVEDALPGISNRIDTLSSDVDLYVEDHRVDIERVERRIDETNTALETATNDLWAAIESIDVMSGISATNTVFSSAVLAVGLGIDTNTVAVINELVEAGEELPIGGATSVGALLLALAAAIAALKKRLPYALIVKEIENGAVTLDDRASNAVEISATLSPNTLTVNFPATSGKLRDFALRLNIASGVTAPELVLPQGVVCENANGKVPEISDGGTGGSSTILYFSETENNGTTAKFLLKGETLAAITQA